MPRRATNSDPGAARRESVHTDSNRIRATAAASIAPAVAVTISSPVQTIDDHWRARAAAPVIASGHVRTKVEGHRTTGRNRTRRGILADHVAGPVDAHLPAIGVGAHQRLAHA